MKFKKQCHYKVPSKQMDFLINWCKDHDVTVSTVVRSYMQKVVSGELPLKPVAKHTLKSLSVSVPVPTAEKFLAACAKVERTPSQVFTDLLRRIEELGYVPHQLLTEEVDPHFYVARKRAQLAEASARLDQMEAKLNDNR